MSEFFIEYGLFLLKVAMIVIAIVIVMGVAASIGRKASREGLEVESINQKYKSLASALRQAVLNKDERKKEAKAEKKRDTRKAKKDAQKANRVHYDSADLHGSLGKTILDETMRHRTSLAGMHNNPPILVNE